jgi:hypothetical protein
MAYLNLTEYEEEQLTRMAKIKAKTITGFITVTMFWMEVNKWHAYLRTISRRTDSKTGPILGLVDRSMLIGNPEERISAHVLGHALESILVQTRSDKNLQETIPETLLHDLLGSKKEEVSRRPTHTGSFGGAIKTEQEPARLILSPFGNKTIFTSQQTNSNLSGPAELASTSSQLAPRIQLQTQPRMEDPRDRTPRHRTHRTQTVFEARAELERTLGKGLNRRESGLSRLSRGILKRPLRDEVLARFISNRDFVS